MTIPNFKFTDFTSESSFLWLKKKFTSQDLNNGPFEEIKTMISSLSGEPFTSKTLPENPVIKIELDALNGQQKEIIEKEFFKDYLEPRISIMSEEYFEEIKVEIVHKSIFEEKTLEGFIKHIITNRNKEEKIITNAEYLSPQIKTLLHIEIQKLTTLLEQYLKNPYPEIKKKLQFKWNRTDIIYFFHLLRKNKVISHVSDADLGRFIDNTCEYLNESDFAEIKDSRKHLSDYNSGSRRPETPAIERIKNIFSSETFFD